MIICSGELFALDILEEWMGLRTRLETVGTNLNHVTLVQNVGPRSTNINNDKTASGNSSGSNSALEPAGWVAEVGVGKEWDKVGGYWRFSDLIKYGDLGFSNSGTPGSRGVILDLSKYGNALEIFGGVGADEKVMTWQYLRFYTADVLFNYLYLFCVFYGNKCFLLVCATCFPDDADII